MPEAQECGNAALVDTFGSFTQSINVRRDCAQGLRAWDLEAGKPGFQFFACHLLAR